MKNFRMALIFAGVLLSGCFYKGIGPYESIDYEASRFGRELWLSFPGVFRNSNASLELDQSEFGTKKLKNHAGYIPMTYGIGVNHRDICNRRKNPDCTSFLFGEELLKHPALFEEVKKWILNVCANLPQTVSEAEGNSYGPSQPRQRDLERLKEFMSCDSEIKGRRPVFIYIIRDFDELFVRKNFSRDFDDISQVEPFIAQRFVLTINP